MVGQMDGWIERQIVEGSNCQGGQRKKVPTLTQVREIHSQQPEKQTETNSLQPQERKPTDRQTDDDDDDDE